MRINNRILIFTIVAVTPLLDALNGFFSMYLPGFLEQIVPNIRIIFILIFIYGILKLNTLSFIMTITLSLFVVTQAFIVSFINGGSMSDMLTNITLVIKLLYFFTLSLYFYESKKISNYTLNDFIPYIRFYAYSMPILIILPANLGLGRVTYSSSEFGNSGFFIANNASNIALISAMFITLIFLVNSIKIIDILFIFIQMYALLIQGAKTGIIIGIFIILILVIHTIHKYIMPPYKGIHVVIFAVAFIMLIEMMIFYSYLYPLVSSKFSTYIEPLVNRQTFLSKQVGGGITSILFSGRLDFVDSIFAYLLTNNNLFSWIFGVGSAYIVKNIGHIAEMDGLDIFFDFGVLGLIITYGITIYILGHLWNNKNIYIKGALLFVIMYSLLAGHVMVDILSSTGVVILLILSSRDLLPQGFSNN
ncbi:hypothetical protein EFT44_10415 [Leuconostoc falkenbergense]|uniref:hypothetical protein n=1 Tax=Leuconostoc falkenbergense TaxID=2766470 RepID=UPI0021AA6C05|nr:hypothetical protein [Leuconostoc falkenbergense]MCT4411955.1 hypothetical protein [Leuconostoc falkenbergense]